MKAGPPPRQNQLHKSKLSGYRMKIHEYVKAQNQEDVLLYNNLQLVCPKLLIIQKLSCRPCHCKN